MVEGHEAEGRVHPGVDHGEVKTVVRGDARPVGHGRAAERIDADGKTGVAHRVHVDHGIEVGDVRPDEVLRMDVRRLDRGGIVHPPDAGVARAQQFVGARLDPVGDVGVGRTAVRRVVLDTAVGRRIVRGRHHDAVRAALAALAVLAVVHQDGARDGRRRRKAVIGLDHRLHAIGGEHRERVALRGPRQRVGVLAEKQRTADALGAAVVADRLGDGEDVVAVEAAAQRAAAVAAGAEAHPLVGILPIRRALAIGALERRDVDQAAGGCGLPRLGVYRHVLPPWCWPESNKLTAKAQSSRRNLLTKNN